MKATPQLITTGLLLGIACLLILFWGIALYNDAAVISIMSRSRLTPYPPLQQPQTHHGLGVMPVFTTNYSAYQYLREISKPAVRTKKGPRPNESEKNRSSRQTCDVNLSSAKEGFTSQLKKQKQKQMRILEIKQKLFDMNILTPEEWGQFVTGLDPITIQIETLLESKSELTPQDYEEISGNIKATRKTAGILRMMQEEIARDIVDKEAERVQAAQKT